MLDGWSDGPPEKPGTYWVVCYTRAGLSRPEVWEIQGFKDNLIFGKLAPWIWIDKAIIAMHLSVLEDTENDSTIFE